MHKAVTLLLAFSSLGSLGSVGALAGCTAAAAQVAPPQFDFYFPTGLVISPDEKYLFVLSADSDLRYSSGAMQVVDLDKLDAVANTWRDSRQAPAACSDKQGHPTVIATRPTILSCPTSDVNGNPTPPEGSFVIGGSSVQIGSFGVSSAIQALKNEDGSPSTLVRVLSTVRGDPSITWADFDESTQKLDCGGTGAFPRCDEPHRLARIRDDATLPSLSAEPFAIAVDDVGGHGFVTHLVSGIVTLLNTPNTVGSSPLIVDINTTLWQLNNQTAAVGAAGVAVRSPGDPLGLAYVTSNSEARVAVVHAVDMGTDGNGLPRAALARTSSFLYSGLSQAGDPGDSRSLAFSADGNRAFIVGRLPPVLYTFDTSLDAHGAPRNTQVGSVELCDEVANLSLADFGEGLRIIMPCFTTGQVLVVDPAMQSIIAVEDAGRGPNGIATSPLHNKIYVGNYAEDTIMVLDATPGSASQNRVLLRIGNFRIVESQSQ